MISEFFSVFLLPFSFPWPDFFIGAFAFAMLFKLLIWLLFRRKWVKTK